MAEKITGNKADRKTGLGMIDRVAPAVALLLFGDAAFAVDDDRELPEPSVIALLAGGAAAAGVVNHVRKRKRK